MHVTAYSVNTYFSAKVNVSDLEKRVSKCTCDAFQLVYGGQAGKPTAYSLVFMEYYYDQTICIQTNLNLKILNFLDFLAEIPRILVSILQLLLELSVYQT